MEVHHHSHSSRKKWTHYFLEFIMLFLAVFCGFLAEYKLEHVIEHNREKEYMNSMVEDLKSDTTFLNVVISKWSFVNTSIDSLADAIQLPVENTDLKKVYRHINNALNYWAFRFNDRTISQLKNSGNFRLIRNKEVANKIIDYDRLNTNAMVIIEAQRNKFYENVTDKRNEIFDQQIINTIRNRYGVKPVAFSENVVLDSMLQKSKVPLSQETQAALLFEFKNALLAYRNDYRNLEWGYGNIINMVNELMLLIRKAYHLK